MARYIKNPIQETIEIINSFNFTSFKQELKKKLNEKLQEQNSNYPFNSNYSLISTGKKVIDTGFYTGSGVNIYLYWRLYLMHNSLGEREPALEALKKSITSLEINMKLINEFKKSAKKEMSPSFFMGDSGMYTMGTLLYQAANDDVRSNSYFQMLCEEYVLCKGSKSENELLYGKAGFLYCLLLLKTYGFKIDELIIDTVDIIYKNANTEQGILIYYFPKSESKIYYGGAHGLLGITYLLLKAFQFVPSLKNDQNKLILLNKTCKYLLSLQFSSGNFPSSEGSKSDKLVHFCHGAPGSIAFFIEANTFWNEKEYFDAAIKAGDCVWERGILLKGNGVCHGISGNGYSLYMLYRKTNDLKWLFRVAQMIEFTWNPQIQAIINQQEDPSRKIPNCPDTPFSLMEGIGGQICLYADFLGNNMKFPGYEI